MCILLNIYITLNINDINSNLFGIEKYGNYTNHIVIPWKKLSPPGYYPGDESIIFYTILRVTTPVY